MDMTPQRAARLLRALQDVTDLAAIDDHGCTLLRPDETFGDAVNDIIAMLEQQVSREYALQQERIAAMTKIMVQARRMNEDVGELIAAALQRAATKLGNAELLVAGRPGSWEAEITRRMAQAGGSGNARRIQALSALFITMGKAGEDGGDVLSQAMSHAVDEVGGLDQFAGGSDWYWDLTNMGRQYSTHWND